MSALSPVSFPVTVEKNPLPLHVFNLKSSLIVNHESHKMAAYNGAVVYNTGVNIYQLWQLMLPKNQTC